MVTAAATYTEQDMSYTWVRVPCEQDLVLVFFLHFMFAFDIVL